MILSRLNPYQRKLPGSHSATINYSLKKEDIIKFFKKGLTSNQIEFLNHYINSKDMTELSRYLKISTTSLYVKINLIFDKLNIATKEELFDMIMGWKN